MTEVKKIMHRHFEWLNALLYSHTTLIVSYPPITNTFAMQIFKKGAK